MRAPHGSANSLADYGATGIVEARLVTVPLPICARCCMRITATVQHV